MSFISGFTAGFKILLSFQIKENKGKLIGPVISPMLCFGSGDVCSRSEGQMQWRFLGRGCVWF